MSTLRERINVYGLDCATCLLFCAILGLLTADHPDSAKCLALFGCYFVNMGSNAKDRSAARPGGGA